MPTNPNTPNAHPSGLPECPFTDPRNVGVFTTKFVMEGEPICFVYRDWEDAAWQFLSDRATEQKDAMLVCLEEIFRIDQSIGELADLPAGWMASRPRRDGVWERKRHHPFPVFAEDGFYLDDATAYERLYPETYQVPSQQIRESLLVGDLVKLIFRFADEQAPRKDNECERMWVLVTEVDGENCRYKGTLDNDPLLHNEIACGRELWLHPIHIFAKFRVLK